MSRKERIEERVLSQLSPTHMLVVDDSHGHARGLETHYSLLVVSEKFDGMSRVDRQRLIMSLLKDEFEAGLHALSQKIYSPSEWDKVKDQFQFDVPACGGKKPR